MPYDASDLAARYASGASSHPNGKPLANDAGDVARRVAEPDAGRLGAAIVRDSARRSWRVEARRDRAHGRVLVVRPEHGDLEPFRASADGHDPERHLPIAEADWTVLALLASGHDGGDGRDDPELRDAAFRIVDRMVRDAQHRQLLGAVDDEDA
jgi:hypothetical protein